MQSGTDIKIVASNDITIDDDIITTTGAGTLTLIAGRLIKINRDVKINGGLVMTANTTSDVSDGYSGGKKLILADRDAGRAEITVASGKTVSGDDNDLLIKMLTGKSGAAADNTQTDAITVWEADGKRVSIVHLGTTTTGVLYSDSEIIILSDGQSVFLLIVLLYLGRVFVRIQIKIGK